MFKAARWRNEKLKITSVFKFQFYLTQASEFGGSALVLSVVPAENGKPTAKLEKCVIRENSCYWENPVYETVKLIQDPKTAKIHERIYYFIISTVSPKGGSLVGEFSVNIADYIGATKACSVLFPLKNSHSGSHLHVSIQRIQENSNQRELEESESEKITQEEDRSLRRHFSNGDVEETVKTIEDEPLRKTVSHLPGLNGVRRGSSGSDITLSSTDSSSGLHTPRELGVRNNLTNRDHTSNGSDYQDQHITRWDLAIVPVNGSCTDNSMSSPRNAFSSDRSQMGLDDSVEKLRADLIALSRRAEVSEIELHTLRKQIVKESKKGQDLLKEITSLKEERDSLKDECERFKTLRRRSDDTKVRSKLHFEGDPWTLVEEIREELNYEKDLNANLRLQLEKTQDSNAELILAVQDLEEMLEKNSKRVANQPNRSASGESTIETEDSILKCQSDDDEEQKALEALVRQHSDAQETYLLEQKVMDLCSEIEMYRRDKDELEMQMEQLALDYEILKQENHEYSCRLEQSHLQQQVQYECSSSHGTMNEVEAQKEKLQHELTERSKELSLCLATMKELEARNWSLEEELDKQVEKFKTETEAAARAQVEQEQRAVRAEEALARADATINQLETETQTLKQELNKRLQELSSSLDMIKKLENHNLKLEEDLERQAQGFEFDMEGLVHANTELEERALNAEEAVSSSNATINELESRIRRLENELRKHSLESSDTLATVKELEAHIRNLEEELEKQAEGFEADLEAVTRAKVEQEKRAIKAEESLRLMKWKNANTAARIQDEFKRLSNQVQSSFDANEKLASKALTEASELRMQNRQLRDMLQNANEELQSAKYDYEAKLQELCGQNDLKSSQIEQMVVEIEEKGKVLEDQKLHTDEVQKGVSEQQSELRSQIERLILENASLAEQAKQAEKLKSELEQMKTLIKKMERENSESKIDLVQEVAGKSLEELDMLRNHKDEREQEVLNLQSEVEILKSQCDDLKHSLFEDELEKEKLRKQVFQLKADLKKKDEVVSSIEKKLKENELRVVIHDRSKATSKNSKAESVQHGSKEVGAKEVATLKEKIKFLEGQIKSKETTYETSANAFLAKEKNLYGKIEELEIRLKELNSCSPAAGQVEVKEDLVSVGMQVDCNAEEVTSAGDPRQEASTTADLTESDQLKASTDNSADQQKFDILLKEMVILKERNDSMETELKDMQERYSEMSLKFAEVEGERQKLVMTLRSIKNRKS